MEKKIIDFDITRLRSYNDNLARRPEPIAQPVPEIKPAPQKGVRTHSLPKRKSSVRIGWIAAVVAVAAVYMLLIAQYMTLTELSLEASVYEQTIRTSNEEISKMKKFTLKQIDAEQLDAFIRANDMDVLERSSVEYIDSARDEVIISYMGSASESEAGRTLTFLEDKVEKLIEFFR